MTKTTVFGENLGPPDVVLSSMVVLFPSEFGDTKFFLGLVVLTILGPRRSTRGAFQICEKRLNDRSKFLRYLGLGGK